MIARIYPHLHTDGMNQLQINIKFLMERDGHNPNSLAEAAKAKQPNIFRIVEGESLNPHDSTIAPLASYWGVTVADLRYKDLTGASGKPTAAPQALAANDSPDMIKADDAASLMRLFADSTPKGRELILRAAYSAPKIISSKRKAGN